MSDKSGKTILTARKGTFSNSTLPVTNTVTASVDANSVNYRPLVYFYILDDQTVSISGTATYTVEDLITGQPFSVPQGNWPAGFYRLILTSGQVQVTYTNYYLDVAC